MELKSDVLNVAKNQCFNISPKFCSCMSVSFVYNLHLHSSSWKLAGINNKPNWWYSKTIKRLLEALTHAFCQFSCSSAAKAAADFESKVERPLRRLSCLPKRRSPWPTARHGNSIGAMVKSLQWWPHSCILVWVQLGRLCATLIRNVMKPATMTMMEVAHVVFVFAFLHTCSLGMLRRLSVDLTMNSGARLMYHE